MAQQTINIGSSANKGDGDPIRTAFTKVNANFTEVYTKLTALEDGSIVTDIKGTIVGDDSTILVDGVKSSINLAGTVKGDIIPDTNVAYDIGSATKRFKDLYLSGNTIDLGGTALSIVAGQLQIGGAGVSSTVDYNDIQNKPTIPADVGDLTDTGGLLGAGGIALTDLSVGAEASASGDGGIAYDNSTGVFTYTPPDLSGYQATLVSGTSIKTINGTSLLGSGDVTVSASGADLSAVNQNYTPDTDNAYDLGTPSNFLRTGYFGTSVRIGPDQFSAATLSRNSDGHLVSSSTINTFGLTSSSYLSISAGFGGLIFWGEEPTGGANGHSGFNGNGEMVWFGGNYALNGPTYQLDKDQANLQIGGAVTKTISGVTLGATTSLSFSDPYYFSPNSTVTITGVVGTTELNNQTYFINGSNELFTDAALTTPLNSSAFTAYVSGGTAVVAPRATASLPVLHSAPTTPKSGMMAVADGTNWNPTSTGTETMVVYLGGAWRTVANA